MNKVKFILPLFVVAPTIFACNKGGVAGNYVVDENIAYEFKIGTKENYENDTKNYPTTCPAISKIQGMIYDDLTTYYSGARTLDKAVHLTNDYALQRKTINGETIETKAVNVNEDESGGYIKFEWGKEKSGYHFYENHTDYVDYFQVETATEGSGATIRHLRVSDNGFVVDGNTLTASFVAKVTEGSEVETLKYQIDFTVTAKK